MKKLLIFLGLAFMVLIVVGIASLVYVTINQSTRDKATKQYVNDVKLVVPLPCGPGLAAQDLAGVCRAIPKSTSGALEAVSAPNSLGMKVQNQSKSAPKK